MIRRYLKTVLLIMTAALILLPVTAVFAGKNPGYLRIPLLDSAETLDPGLVQSVYDGDASSLLFVPLTKYDRHTMKVLPNFATSWKVTKGGTVYTMDLRRDIKWTTGEPVTAYDFQWALRRNLNPKTASPYVFIAYIVKNAEAINKGTIKDSTKLGIKALGKWQLQFTLEKAAGYFPSMLTMPIYFPLHRKTVEKYGVDWIKPENYVSCGPYKLDKWLRGNMIQMKANKLYPGYDKINIKEIRYLVIRQSSTGLAMYENDEVDMLGGDYLPIPTAEIARIKTDPKLGKEFSIEPRLCTYYYHFNTLRKPTDNPLVRQAIAHAIDRQMITDKVLKGGQQPANTFVRPPIFGSVDPSEGVGRAFNVKKAKELLAKAGYPGGKGFPEIELMHNTSEQHAQVAQAVQYLLKKNLGITVKITNQEFRVFLNTRKSENAAHINRNGWCADYPDANNWLHEQFHPTKSENDTHWKNVEFASVTDKAQLVTNPAERKKLYKRAEQILTEEETVMIPIYYYTVQTLVKPWLKNYFRMPMGWQFVDQWELE